MGRTSKDRPLVGAAIRRARNDAGLTQLQLAERIGYSQAAVGMWETDRHAVTTGALVEISRVTGVSVDDLLAEQLEPAA